MADPVTGKTGSLFRNDGFDPLWMETNTSTEYWQKGALCDRDGTYSPFPRTRAEREARGDPRPSLEERYGSHAAYVKRYEETVQRLVKERLLLPEDGQRYLAKARSEAIAGLFGQAVAGVVR